MQVFPEFENLFSANGYLGVNSQFGSPRNLNNMKLVFSTSYLGNINFNNAPLVFNQINLKNGIPKRWHIYSNNSGISSIFNKEGLTIYDNTTATNNAYYYI